MKPFFSFYGGKWRGAPHYSPPEYSTIVEPFAGSAGYSVRHASNNVVLVERDPLIAETWRYLLAVSEAEILSLPDIDLEGSVDDLRISPAARLLIGWWINKGSAAPKKRPSANMRKSVLGERPKDPPSGWWGEAIRHRIASQIRGIRHWRLIEGDYSEVPPDVPEATWFIDPPYQQAGKHYTHGSKDIDFARLGRWCQDRRGQVVVCENAGADWLPFVPHRREKAQRLVAGKRESAEVVWTS